MPNNPNYEAGAWTGSACDTITYQTEISANIPPKTNLNVNSLEDMLYININDLKNEPGWINIIDAKGKIIFKSEVHTQSGYYSNNLSIASFARGLYIITYQSKSAFLSTKFVK
jgi:hypothetical protein